MSQQSIQRIYFDHASATACSDSVYKAILPYFRDQAFNPSALYQESVAVNHVVQISRETVARVLRAHPTEIYFVDGATEANNMAIIGAVHAWQQQNPGKTAHIVTSTIEHAAILETCAYLEAQGVEVTYVGVDEQGNINLKELKESLQSNTVIVSIGYVNGEIGTIQDIKSIMKTIRHYRKHHESIYPYMHTDAVQAVNYVDDLGVPQLGIDMMTINAAKIYGPKKIAVLYKKRNVEIHPIVFGGNQERGLRSGTENVPYVVGMTEALSETRALQTSEKERLQKLSDYLIESINTYDNTIVINSSAEERIPNIVNISIPNISHEELVIRLDAVGFMCSVKSACKAGEDGDSHVIRAIADGNRPTGSLRISLGRTSTLQDCERFMEVFVEVVNGMKEIFAKYY